jgi:hypothetical protein
MLPLALEPMLRPVLVRMPRQALAALSVMEPVMDLAMGQGIRGSDLKTALVLDLQSSALNPKSFDLATGADSSVGDCPSLYMEYHVLAKRIFIPIATFAKYGLLSRISAKRQLCDTYRN